jgi:hypothetical protein
VPAIRVADPGDDSREFSQLEPTSDFFLTRCGRLIHQIRPTNLPDAAD